MEQTFGFLANALEKANAKGAFNLQESAAVFQALAQLQGHLFPKDGSVPPLQKVEGETDAPPAAEAPSKRVKGTQKG